MYLGTKSMAILPVVVNMDCLKYSNWTQVRCTWEKNHTYWIRSFSNKQSYWQIRKEKQRHYQLNCPDEIIQMQLQVITKFEKFISNTKCYKDVIFTSRFRKFQKINISHQKIFCKVQYNKVIQHKKQLNVILQNLEKYVKCIGQIPSFVGCPILEIDLNCWNLLFIFGPLYCAIVADALHAAANCIVFRILLENHGKFRCMHDNFPEIMQLG